MRSTVLFAILFVSVAAGCAPKVEVVEPAPVTVEPTYTGKYK